MLGALSCCCIACMITNRELQKMKWIWRGFSCTLILAASNQKRINFNTAWNSQGQINFLSQTVVTFFVATNQGAHCSGNPRGNLTGLKVFPKIVHCFLWNSLSLKIWQNCLTNQSWSSDRHSAKSSSKIIPNNLFVQKELCKDIKTSVHVCLEAWGTN